MRIYHGVLLVCTICFLDDPRKTLRECRRVLNDGGRLVIGFVPSDSPWGIYHSTRGKRGHTFYSSAHFYTSDEIKALAERAGFTCQAEHGCALPIPDESLGNDDISGQRLRDESFVVLSFFRKNKMPG
ncbi:MAG: class I SAM-dependent methyltransferase [Desulfobulbus sp.]